MLQFERCFIMLCNNLTEEECLLRNLFGDKAKRFEYLDEIEPGDIGFLLNIEKDELIGIFRACSEPQLHIEPGAWDGRFAAQVRVELISKHQRIKDAAFILNKAGVGMSQLKSGAPAPQFPVHGRDVGEKILTYFKEPIQ
ncbi:MAG TPA: hypothetical protein VMW72_27050 [Sedimentisphaerales bacterium]|nr:hypothetical protein [Sedimentisphaerales bacterium]